jgi:NTE family protein
LLTTAGCATGVYQNKAIPDIIAADRAVPGRGGYRIAAMKQRGSPELLMMLTFSGGGKRSSAFSYGVLRGLRHIPIRTGGQEHTLLDEVDGIEAVSGGSFTAAYYGLYRDKTFRNFESDFLKQDIESYIWGLYLLPWNWGWIFDPSYGTSDAMQDVYDDLMFHGATFADLSKNGPPVIWIGATDIGYGRVFTFRQDAFDLICSDLSRFPVARAVAASNALPILLSPITLQNHAKECGGFRPEWMDFSFGDEDADTRARRKLLLDAAQDYLDSSRTPYIHLSDGGIVDNLALRGLINTIIALQDEPRAFRAFGAAEIRRVVVITADGEAAQDTRLVRNRVVTGIGQIISAVTGSQIDNYNFETLGLARLQIHDLVERIKAGRCRIAPEIDGHRCDDVKGSFVHLSLSGIRDAAVRQRLQRIPTGLTISDDDVDALAKAGEEQVRASPEIVELVRDLGESGAPQGPGKLR